MSVLIVTSLGDIVIDLHVDRCPLTAKNFLKLCKMKYYNGCLFYKVEKDFLAQTGDPTGTGSGGDSVYKFLYGNQARFFDDEIHLELKHKKIGTVAMASGGKNLNASQFYFTLRDDLDYLDEKHTVFGIVEEDEGLETLAKINEAYVDDNGRPYKNIRIKHTYILDDPFPDPTELAEFIPEKSPEGKPVNEIAPERLEDNWVPLDEKYGSAELEELIRSKEAHTNAAILESIGDIPDADIKPPENVLFVCKLNPVTQDEDLHTIFSRFGNVTSADVIRDYKTGDSLCYAFIEFEAKEACEMAYSKMDNVLIDDRRIHVDFSQSVAKLWSQYRQGRQKDGKGSGCFRCGASDHIARDCPQESRGKEQVPKYVLKEDNIQRGGGHQSYDMVFDGDGGGGELIISSRPQDEEIGGRSKRHKTERPHSENSRQKGQYSDSWHHKNIRDPGESRGQGDGHRDRDYRGRRDHDVRDKDNERDKYQESDRYGRKEGLESKRHYKSGQLERDPKISRERKDVSDPPKEHREEDRSAHSDVRKNRDESPHNTESKERRMEKHGGHREGRNHHESHRHPRDDHESRRSSELDRRDRHVRERKHREEKKR